MDFARLESRFQQFFRNDGIADEDYEEQKQPFLDAMLQLNRLLLQGICPAEKNSIRSAQEISVLETDPRHRSLQQIHYFIKLLNFEKAIWSRCFRFVNFDLYNTLTREERWKEPKSIEKVVRRQHITSYADSVLNHLKESEHVIYQKIKGYQKLNNIYMELCTKIRQLKQVAGNMHDEKFCASHYHFIRPLLNEGYHETLWNVSRRLDDI